MVSAILLRSEVSPSATAPVVGVNRFLPVVVVSTASTCNGFRVSAQPASPLSRLLSFGSVVAGMIY